MKPPYAIANTADIISPALLFFKDLIQSNLLCAVKTAGGPERLRPHVKTHKTREIVRMERQAGITKHKCATLAEAEMVASCGPADVLIAYPLVGPNCARLARLAARYPQCRFSVTADHPAALEALSKALAAEGQTVDVLLDVDMGMHRTGIAPGPEAQQLYRRIARLVGLRPGGIHAYDGHNHQESLDERQSAALSQLDEVRKLRSALEAEGLSVPRVVVGGTPTFGVFARLDLPGLECSPGTLVLHDHGYSTRYPDMPGFTPAALLLTRVISRPTRTRVTLDLGYKAVASDPPAGKRLVLLDVPEYEAVLQNEEHLVIETPAADRFNPGDEVLAIPTHVCPTCAMHRHGYVVEAGRITGTWDIVGRDRALNI
jgi:D-serine deaminase-like pyridoxal phosphate-dependent protein